VVSAGFVSAGAVTTVADFPVSESEGGLLAAGWSLLADGAGDDTVGEEAEAAEGVAAGGCASVLGADDGVGAGCEVGAGVEAADSGGVVALAEASAFGDPAVEVAFPEVSSPERGKPSRRQRSHPRPTTSARATTTSSTQALLDLGSSSSSSR
jgi:hypothetical protein